ncbi:lysine--tRNA ligase, cytoplasmic-like protein, partial [Tanacetum coccineum]
MRMSTLKQALLQVKALLLQVFNFWLHIKHCKLATRCANVDPYTYRWVNLGYIVSLWVRQETLLFITVCLHPLFFSVKEALIPGYMVEHLRKIPQDTWLRMWKRPKEITYHFEYKYHPKEDDAVNMIWRQHFLSRNGHGLQLRPDGMISQEFFYEGSDNYLLTFTLVPITSDCANNATAINVSGPLGSKLFFYKESLGKETWQTYAYSLWYFGSMTLQIESVAASSHGDIACWPIIDDLLLTGIDYADNNQ